MNDTAFADIKPDDFPFTIEYLDDADEVVWSQEVPGPGVVEVPSYTELGLPGEVAVRLTFPGGRQIIAFPDR